MSTEYFQIANREDWLAMRAQDVTSTEASALFGLSPYETLFELWHRKKAGITSSIDDNERMQAGRHIEPAIASLVSERYALVAAPMKQYARRDRMGSSFDYKVIDATDAGGNPLADIYNRLGPGILECKNVDSLIYKRAWTDDEAPDHIEIQLQHQLELTGMPWGAIACLVGGNTLRLLIREPDKAMGRVIRQRVAKFWQSIEANEAPEPVMPDDAASVIALYQDADPSQQPYDGRGDEGLLSLAKHYYALGESIKQAEEAREVAKATILQYIGTAPKLILDEGYSFTTSHTKDTEPTIITPDMVGKTYGGRKGYRQFRINAPKQTREKVQ